MVTELDLVNAREQIQNDLDCFLDGIDEQMGEGTFEKICAFICDRFEPLLDKVKNAED